MGSSRRSRVHRQRVRSRDRDFLVLLRAGGAADADRTDNLTCFATTTLKEGYAPFAGRLSYEVTVCFPNLLLNNGSFRFVVFLFDEHGVHIYYQKVAEQTFTIATDEKEWGIFHLDQTWTEETEGAAMNFAAHDAH